MFILRFGAGVVALTGLAADTAERRTQAASVSCVAEVPPSDSGSGRISAVAAGNMGRLAWSDGRPGQFLLRDPSGRTRVVGRSGAGPGEFRHVGSLGWIGDTVWVGDPIAARVQFFSDTGRLLRVRTALPLVGWGARPDGRLIGFGAVALGGPMTLPIAVLAHRDGSTRSDTITTFPRMQAEEVMVPVGGREIPNPHPLMQSTQVGGSADGARYCAVTPTDTDAIRLRCVDDHGRTRLDRSLTLPLRPITDSIYNAVIDQFSRAPGRTAAMMRGRISRPAKLPPVLRLLVDDGGDVWLGRSHRSEATSQWVRVLPTGAIRDTVAIPAPYRIVALQREIVWAVSADADDLETLFRCRVRP